MSIAHEPATSLADHLRENGVKASIGVRHESHGPILIAYLESRHDQRHIPTEWHGLGVRVEVIGKLKPAKERRDESN